MANDSSCRFVRSSAVWAARRSSSRACSAAIRTSSSVLSSRQHDERGAGFGRACRRLDRYDQPAMPTPQRPAARAAPTISPHGMCPLLPWLPVTGALAPVTGVEGDVRIAPRSARANSTRTRTTGARHGWCCCVSFVGSVSSPPGAICSPASSAPQRRRLRGAAMTTARRYTSTACRVGNHEECQTHRIVPQCPCSCHRYGSAARGQATSQRSR